MTDSYIGRQQNRVDGPAKVTGTAKYAAEYDVAGLLHGWIVGSSIARGAITRLDTSQALAFWQMAMPAPDQVKKKIFVDDEVLCTLFERLSDTTEENKLHFRFVLGLILMRKRLLVYETSQTTEGVESWTMRVKGREDRLTMINPKLNEEQVKAVSAQLGEIMNEEL